jgi:hypothetical protein
MGFQAFVAASFGICVNSFLKNARQGGAVFGALLTVTGMLGMLSIMTSGSPTASQIGIASLLVPQGWAVRGLVQTMNGAPFTELVPTVLALAAWGIAFFAVGVWRFRRYTRRIVMRILDIAQNDLRYSSETAIPFCSCSSCGDSPDVRLCVQHSAAVDGCAPARWLPRSGSQDQRPTADWLPKVIRPIRIKRSASDLEQLVSGSACAVIVPPGMAAPAAGKHARL